MIDYLQEDNRVLRARLRGKRLRLSDNERRRLAVKAQGLARKALAQVASIVTPDTLLRWYRDLIAAKYDGSKNCMVRADHRRRRTFVQKTPPISCLGSDLEAFSNTTTVQRG